VFIEAFAFEKPDDFLPGVSFLLWREIDHHGVGLHHAVNRRLHCNSPQALPKTELRFGTKVPNRVYRVQQESSDGPGDAMFALRKKNGPHPRLERLD
jgi:hypothetical protein